jgi:parvulin-like peptidyl-prolyl isomerase
MTAAERRPTNKFCSRCGIVLDEQTAEQLIKDNLERKQADEIMDRLINDQEFRAILERKLKQIVVTA